jgi:hypothetical protein
VVAVNWAPVSELVAVMAVSATAAPLAFLTVPLTPPR